MHLSENVEIVDGTPIAYLRDLKALVCSDLHLGYEGVMAERRRYFLPKTNLSSIKGYIESAAAGRVVEELIVNGDIKNDFSKVHLEEFNELNELVSFSKRLGIRKFLLVKGNHDNFIGRVGVGTGMAIYEGELRRGEYVFAHGDKPVNVDEGKLLIVGHIHPSIALYTKLGAKERLRCFLYGRRGNGRLLVLPAASYFSEGFEINPGSENELVHMLGSNIDLGNIHALCIGEGETLDFGSLRDLLDASMDE